MHVDSDRWIADLLIFLPLLFSSMHLIYFLVHGHTQYTCVKRSVLVFGDRNRLVFRDLDV